jgi:hypothetical protein
LINAGFETPTTSNKVIEDKSTPVAAPANINYLWKPTDMRDQKLWTNVEFVILFSIFLIT